MPVTHRKDWKFIEVHFGEQPHGGYTYRFSAKTQDIRAGMRVKVRFGSTVRIGFVTSFPDSAEQDEIKEITEVLDAEPVISDEMLRFTRWMADYYLCDWGEALKASLPVGLKPQLKARYRLTETGRNDPFIATETGPAAELWRALFKETLTIGQVKRRVKDGEKVFESFRRKGWLEPAESANVQVRLMTDLWTWTEIQSFEEARASLPKNAVKLLSVLEIIEHANGAITREKLNSAREGMSATMRNLTERGWLTHERIPLDKRSLVQFGIEETALGEVVFSSEQKSVIDSIKDAIHSGTFERILLHGVTGSGKSLIYLEAIDIVLKSGKTALVMVPEISLTPQLTGRISRRFGDLVAVTHSGLSPAERISVWDSVKSGRRRIVIGPRSVIFAPVDNLGLIIIDEEHDDSYKQSDPAPRYQGRDAAVYRASVNNAVVLLGSATPDVSSFRNAEKGRYKLLELKERHAGGELPDIWAVKWGVGGEKSSFCPQLKSKLDACLETGQQAIVLVNQRGFSSQIRCPECGEIATCPNCDISLRYHRVGEMLLCHYCGYSQRVLDVCQKCKGKRILYHGTGTQRIERELNILYPDARIARMDLDTTRRVGAHQDILSSFAKREFDILVGTQMVAKGHDFPGVTLVGVLAADFEWSRPDFRTVEKAYRLLAQASGRTGRAGEGVVVIQAWDPTHPLLRWVQGYNYQEMYHAEVNSRQPLSYPPFGRLIRLVLQCDNKDTVSELANKVKDKLQINLKCGIILGPAPPPVEKLEGSYRQNILVKLPERIDKTCIEDKSTIYKIYNEMNAALTKDNSRMIIDVDPVDV